MLASLKPEGRMGIVLDQGALFRGGAEGKIRKQILEKDLVECVVALPEKLFYNTGAPGCLIFLNKNKPSERRGKLLFIHAANGFEKLKNMNRLRNEDIEKLMKAFRAFENVERYAQIVGLAAIQDVGYSLNVTRYVDIFEEDEQIDIAKTWQDLKQLEGERQQLNETIHHHLKELGYEK
jgi:type I restriction enzyme M protein